MKSIKKTSVLWYSPTFYLHIQLAASLIYLRYIYLIFLTLKYLAEFFPKCLLSPSHLWVQRIFITTAFVLLPWGELTNLGYENICLCIRFSSLGWAEQMNWLLPLQVGKGKNSQCFHQVSVPLKCLWCGVAKLPQKPYVGHLSMLSWRCYFVFQTDFQLLWGSGPLCHIPEVRPIYSKFAIKKIKKNHLMNTLFSRHVLKSKLRLHLGLNAECWSGTCHSFI